MPSTLARPEHEVTTGRRAAFRRPESLPALLVTLTGVAVVLGYWRLVRYSAFATSQVGHAAPLLGEHTDEVLSQAGYSPEQIAALRKGSVIR